MKKRILYFGLLLSSFPLYSYSTSVSLVSRNSQNIPSVVFYSSDTQISIDTTAVFCLEPNPQPGQYEFELIIQGPKQLYFSEKSALATLPGIDSNLKYRFVVPTSKISRGTGEYLVKVLFKEIYTAKTLTNFGELRLHYKARSFDLTKQSLPTQLISPVGSNTVREKLPVFQWSKADPLANLSYTIWISEEPNPQQKPFFRQNGIRENIFRYPVNAENLLPGKKYYWKILTLDENNQPYGGYDGYSIVESFQMSADSLPHFSLIYPLDQTLENEEETFFWEELSTVRYYDIIFSSDEEFKSILWAGQSAKNSLKLNIHSTFKNLEGQAIYWKVQANNDREQLISISNVSKFRYAGSAVIKNNDKMNPEKITLQGTIRNLFQEVVEDCYVVVAKSVSEFLPSATSSVDETKKQLGEFLGKDAPDEKYLYTAGALTLKADSRGYFSVELPPGDYEFAVFKNDYVLYTAKINGEKGSIIKKNIQLIPVFGSVSGIITDQDTGNPIANVKVAFRNQYNYQYVNSNEDGSFYIPKVINGIYSLEVSKEPSYNEIIVNKFEVAGNRIRRNFQLEMIKAGSLRGKVVDLNKKLNIGDAIVYVKPLQVSGEIATGQTEGQAISDGNGTFFIADLRIGTYRVYCRAPKFVEFYQDIKISSGQISELTLNLSGIRWKLSGKIIDDYGVPLKNVALNLKEYPNLATSRSDGNGLFEMRLPSGQYDLEAYLPGKNISVQKISINDADSELKPIRLSNVSAYLEVKVITAHNQSLENYKLVFTLANTSAAGSSQEFAVTNGLVSARVAGNTDYNISVVFDGEQALRYRVLPFNYRTKESFVEKMNLVALEVLAVRGQVVNKNQQAIASVELWDNNSQSKIISDSNGNFTLDTIKPVAGMSLLLELKHPEYNTLSFEVNENTAQPLRITMAGLADFAEEALLRQLQSELTDLSSSRQDLEKKHSNQANELKMESYRSQLQELPDNLFKNLEKIEIVMGQLTTLVKKIIEFETNVNNYLKQFSDIKNQISSLEKNLTLPKFGGFDAKISLKGSPCASAILGSTQQATSCSSLKMKLFGYLKIDNLVLGKSETNLDFDIDLTAFLPEAVAQIFKPDFSFAKLAPKTLQALFDEKGYLNISAQLPEAIKQIAGDEQWLGNLLKNVISNQMEQYSNMTPEQLLKKILPAEINKYVPADITKMEQWLAKLLPAKIVNALPKELELSAIKTSALQELENFSIVGVIKLLQKELPKLVLKTPVDLTDELKFSFLGLEGSARHLKIGYDQKENKVYLEGLPKLLPGDILQDLAGISEIKSDRPIRVFDDGSAKLGRFTVAFDPSTGSGIEQGGMKIAGFSAKLTQLAFDFDRRRLELGGEIFLDFIKQKVIFSDAMFDGSQGWALQSMRLTLDPPMRLDYAGWKMVLFNADYTAQGLRLNGDFKIGAPFDTDLKVSDLIIDSRGQIRQAKINNASLAIFKGELSFAGALFQDTRSAEGGEVSLILTDTRLTLALVQDIQIKRIAIFYKDNRCRLSLDQASIPVNKKFTLIGLDVNIEALELGTNADKKNYIKILGALQFPIPTAKVEVGNFMITEDGKMTVDKFGLKIDQGWLAGSGMVEIGSNSFRGAGSLKITGVFSAGFDVEIAPGRWSVMITAGAPIPIAGTPVILEKIRGGLAMQNGVLIVSIGCELSIASILTAEVNVKINTGNGDLTIQGAASLTPIALQLGSFYAYLSPTQGLFEGDAHVQFSQFGADISGKLNFHFSKAYWGVGAYVRVNFAGLIQGYGGFAFGNDYPITYRYRGTTVRSPEKIKGMIFWVGASADLNLGIIKFYFGGELYVAVGSSTSAGLYALLSGELDLYILTASFALSVDLGGQIGSRSTYFAGAVGAKGCIEIIFVGKACAEKTVTFVIGDKPDHEISVTYNTEPAFPAKLDVYGTVENEMGIPLRHAPVVIRKTGSEVLRLTTDERGQFRFKEVPAKGQSYQLVAEPFEDKTSQLLYSQNKSSVIDFVHDQTEYRAALSLKQVSSKDRPLRINVKDKRNNSFLKKAIVIFEDEADGSSANLVAEAGVATLTTAKESQHYKISVQKFGYATKTISHSVSGFDQKNEINAELQYTGQYSVDIPVYAEYPKFYKDQGVSFATFKSWLHYLCELADIKIFGASASTDIDCKAKEVKEDGSQPFAILKFSEISADSSTSTIQGMEFDLRLSFPSVTDNLRTTIIPLVITNEAILFRGTNTVACAKNDVACLRLTELPLIDIPLRVVDAYNQQPLNGVPIRLSSSQAQGSHDWLAAGVTSNGGYAIVKSIAGYSFWVAAMVEGDFTRIYKPGTAIEVNAANKTENTIYLQRTPAGEVLGGVIDFAKTVVKEIEDNVVTSVKLKGEVSFENDWLTKSVGGSSIENSFIEIYAGNIRVGIGKIEPLGGNRYMWSLAIGITDIDRLSMNLVKDIIDKKVSLEFIQGDQRRLLWGEKRNE